MSGSPTDESSKKTPAIAIASLALLLAVVIVIALLASAGRGPARPGGGGAPAQTGRNTSTAPESLRRPPHPKFPTAHDVDDAAKSRRAFVGYGTGDSSPADDLRMVDELIEKFYLLAKDQADRFPMGTNREITRVLAGHNPMKRAWLDAAHPAVSASGELTDRWKSPLHFHALARGVFEIRSAGPDRILFTADDLVHGRDRLTIDIRTHSDEI